MKHSSLKYWLAFAIVLCIQIGLYAGPFTIIYRALPPEDLAEFAPAFIALAIGVGLAAGLLGWGAYKIITKILSIIDARNAKPVER